MNKLKILIAFAFATILIFPAQAQIFKSGRFNSRQVANLPNYDHAPYHFGFILGYNQMNFSILPADYYTDLSFEYLQMPKDIGDLDEGHAYHVTSIENKPHAGFTVGLVGNLRMGKYFDLRFTPSFALASRDLIFYFRDVNAPGNSQLTKKVKTLQSNAIILPLHVKYKSKRIHNMRAYIIGGANLSIDLATGRKQPGSQGNDQVLPNMLTTNFELGAGMDFYAYFFKFGIEAKMAYSLADVLRRPENVYHPYYSAIRRLDSKIFQLSFTFE